MKICVAQTRPVKGNIESNIDHHKRMINLAISNGTEIVIFPELSLTGYEPERAEELATSQDDSRFDEFQHISDTGNIIIGVGVPIRYKIGTCISMILFQPNKPRRTYLKRYLHPDEEKFFTSGKGITGLKVNQTHIAFAICYELSVPEHVENARKSGAEIYIASVAKSVDGVEKAIKRLSGISSNYSMTVFMSNCIGRCDNFEGGGKTSAWNNRGLLVGQLTDKNEGLIIINTDTQKLITKIFLGSVKS